MNKNELENIYETVKQIQKNAALGSYDEVLDLSNELASEIKIHLKKTFEENISSMLGQDVLTQTVYTKREAPIRESIDNKYDVSVVAYYVSRFEHNDLFQGSQQDAYAKIARMLRLKMTSFRNIRDCFDRHIQEIKRVESPSLTIRSGWEAELKHQEQEIFNYYREKSKQDVLSDVKRILKI